MSNFTVIIPISDLAAVNTALEAAGFGPDNFKRTCATGDAPEATHAALHSWADPPFRQAFLDLQQTYPALEIHDGDGTPNTDAVLAQAGLRWIEIEGEGA